ncbi:Hydrogenase transcriptional regulatory protein hupR1 [Fundidesulfovibrio magnetotacticus]|uniref:Hydrogenase transcriptional regulatory protein hupR1 n=1 Tax=Fundidesulfovibrio magnetotacticus TaxID=2730080 RepID=A0A6V8LMV0_9BACT|nr:response regulator [Fundidesulfovibrio magnetotacticus]GFK93004.1 Hydrogenase transcriptional regulatory protein hupR1 [Fundidesulfovibrio magnetotacticus]
MNDLVLIVDDEPHVLDALKTALRGRFSVHTALGPQEGLDRVRSGEPYAVVISDLKMPGMDGIAFLASVRELSPGATRIMLTGHGDMDAAMKAVNSGGVFRFFTKPCPTPVLVEAIREGIVRHQEHAAIQALRQERDAGQAPGGNGQDEQAFEARLLEAAGAQSLGAKELKIAAMIRDGLSTKEIALRLHLSSRTVETYRNMLRRKLDLLNRPVNMQQYLIRLSR